MTAPDEFWALPGCGHFWADDQPPKSAVIGAVHFRRADLPPTDEAVMAHPKVRALVWDLKELRLVVENISGEDNLDRELIRAALARIEAAIAALSPTPVADSAGPDTDSKGDGG